jgi:hypothetical protein
MNENATSRQNFENAMKHPIEGTSFGYVRLLFFRRQRLICRAVDRTFGNESDLWFVIACRLPVKSGFSVDPEAGQVTAPFFGNSAPVRSGDLSG